MKFKKYFLIFFAAFLGCNFRTPPHASAFIGIWKNIDGSQIELNNDGTFTAKSLPKKIFFLEIDSLDKIERFNGEGHWAISEWKFQFPSIIMKFEQSTYERLSTEIYVSGAGFWEYSPPWNNLFVWVEEEGGERYNFVRKEH